MTDATVVHSSNVSVVLVGSFNPLIFQPQWLSDHGIVGEAEAKQAVQEQRLEVLHPQVTSLNLAWMNLLVTLERFAVTVTEEPLIRASDFSASCFGLLSHTPVRALGLNRTVVFKAPSEAAWHALGDAIGPKEPWAKFLEGGEASGKRTGGLRVLLMERSLRPDNLTGYIRVKVEAVEGSPLHTLVEVNDHFQLATSIESVPADRAVEMIRGQWDASMSRATEIIASVRSLCRVD